MEIPLTSKRQYATNGGEYHIKELGYFLDYYNKDKKLVIEWDEKSHYDIIGALRPKDVLREFEIKDYLGCVFIRIKETDFEEENSIKRVCESVTL